MVAKIKSGKSLKGALNYNERKVSQGKAELIAAQGYLKDASKLSFYNKLFRLTDLASRNERTKTNCVHISLNFPNGETLADEILRNIVQEYMNGIGFAGQPYLIYRHYDAGHPHIHIVSTNIQPDGQRISLHYIGQDKSEKIRKEIEIQYNLTKAEGRQERAPNLKAVKAEYGKDETKRMITNILGEVIRTWKFTSIPELNAILKRYNVAADMGTKDSRQFARGGLVYWVLDAQGNKTGLPIKASSIYGKPTLKTLAQKFRLNEILCKPLKLKLTERIDKIITPTTSINAFQKAAARQDIEIILRRNGEGRLYGVTFIDLQNKAVFNGSDLGKAYSANAIAARFQQTDQIGSPNTQQTTESFITENTDGHLASDIVDILLGTDQNDVAAYNKIKKQSKKRTKRLNI